MAVSTDNAFSGPYLTNGVTKAFPFTFTAPSADEVDVVLRDAAGNDTVLSGFTVTLNPGGGGAAVFAAAPAPGHQLYVLLEPQFTQDIAFENGSAWRAEPVNEAYDRSAIRDQALKREADRSLKVPVGEQGLAVPIASVRASKALFFNEAGDVDPISVDDFSAPARDAERKASNSAAAAEGAAGINEYDSIAEGEAKTSPGGRFSVRTAQAGVVLVYERTAGGSSFIRTVLSGEALAAPTGAGMVGLLQGGKVADAIRTLTPEQFGAVGDGVADDTSELRTMLAVISTGTIKKATLSRVYRTTSALTIPFAATIEWIGDGKLVVDHTGVGLDCSAGSFHLIAPHIEGPYVSGTPLNRPSGTCTGIWLDGKWNGAGVAPEYVQGGRIDRPHIHNFERSAIETRLWQNGVVTDPRIHDCGYAGVLNQNSKGFRGYGDGLIENIGQNHPTGNAYGHTNTRRTDGVYSLDIVASPRSTNARVYGWTGRNIPWNAFDSHAGSDIVYTDCVAEECTFPFGLVGSSGQFGIQRSGLIRPIIRNAKNGPTHTLIKSGVSTGLNASIVVQGVNGVNPARDCFVIDPVFEYTGEDVAGSGCIVLQGTERMKIRGVRAKGCARHTIALSGGDLSNKDLDIADVEVLNQGSDNGNGVYSIFIDGAGGNTGTIRDVTVKQDAEFDWTNPILGAVYPGNSELNAVRLESIRSLSSSIPLVASAQGSGIEAAPVLMMNAGARPGGVAGWAAPSNSFPYMMTLPASQAGAVLIVPVNGLQAGSFIRGFHLVGRVASSGGVVSVSAQLVRSIPTSGSMSNSTVGSAVTISASSNTVLDAANTKASGLSAEVNASSSYAIRITATTDVSTEMSLLGVGVYVGVN